MRNLITFAVGGLFGLGLLISGMTDTTKVIGWLDVFGAWDPTLAFVLGGAILPMAVAWQIGARRGNRAFNGMMLPSPSNAGVDRSLVVGSTLFGMGWGLAGLCPGPALASAMFGGVGGLAFLLAMALGMFAAPPVRMRLDRAASA